MVNLANEVQKGLNLGLNSWSEVPEEVEDYADTNQAVLFVVGGENLHSDLQEFLHEGAEDLAVRQAVEDLHHDVAELVLGRIRVLRLRNLQENHRERPEVAFQKVQVLGRVRYFEAVTNLHRHLKPLLNRDIGLDEIPRVQLEILNRTHGDGAGKP